MSGLLEFLQFIGKSPSTPHNNEQPAIIKLNIAFIAFTSTFVITRVVVRAWLVKHLSVDDYLMIAAGIFATVLSAMSIYGTYLGLGRHIWDLPMATLIDNLKKIIQTLWICQVMYATALTLVKISIISSYWRIFPTMMVRRTMLVLGGLILSVWLVLIFSTIFQCKPIEHAWNFEIEGKCISVMKVYYFTTAFSIFTDVLLVALPLPLFWKLKLPVREKWIVTVLFGFGLFAAVASIMRITVLHDVQNIDASIGPVPTLNWSVVEVGTGIICACVPCLKPLFKKLMPSKFGTTKDRSARTVVVTDHEGRDRSMTVSIMEEATELKRADTWSKNRPSTSTSKQVHSTTKAEFV